MKITRSEKQNLTNSVKYIHLEINHKAPIQNSIQVKYFQYVTEGGAIKTIINIKNNHKKHSQALIQI